MNIKIDKRIFNEAYLPYIFDYSHRYECYYGGAGSGKSYFVGDKLVLKALQSKHKILVIRKVGNTSRDSTFQLIKDTLHRFKIYDTCKVNKTDLTIELPNGSIFLFKGLDDPEKIKSIAGITTIWVEECTECTLDDISQLDLRLRAKADKLQMFFSFNPVSKDNWVYKYFYRENPEEMPANMFVLKTTYEDNRFLPQSYIESLLKMKDTNPIYYKIYVEGDFATLDKLVYQNVTIKEFDPLPMLRSDDKRYNQVYGMDFGFINDYTALVCGVIDEVDNILYIYDEHYQKGMLTNDIVNMVKDKQLHKTQIICDRQEARLIEELRKAGLNVRKCTKGRGSIMQGITKVQSYRIVVNPKCENLIAEFNNYCYVKDKKTGEYINEPIDAWNHGLDALRYGIQSARKKAKVLEAKL